MGKKLTSDETLTAVLSYLGILVIIPLVVVKKRNDFINFHLKQGLTLFIAEIVVWVALFILMFIPFIGGIFAVLATLFWILVMVIVIVSLVKALMGEKWKIPVIYDMSKRWKF